MNLEKSQKKYNHEHSQEKLFIIKKVLEKK